MNLHQPKNPQDIQQVIVNRRPYTKLPRVKFVKTPMHAKHQSTSDHLHSNSNLHESDERYKQALPSLMLDFKVTANEIHTVMHSAKEERNNVSRSSHIHNLQNMIVTSDTQEESISEDSEGYSSNEDDSPSAFDINFLLNPDPNECSASISNTRNAESPKHLTTCTPVYDTPTITFQSSSTKFTAAKMIDIQKLKFVHFPNPLNPSIDEKGYRCTVCKREFQRPSTLRTHMYSHTGEKPFMCSFEGCSKRFSVESNMRRHLRLHLTSNQRAKSSSKRKTWVHTFTHHFNA